jgi:hypothetical protein
MATFKVTTLRLSEETIEELKDLTRRRTHARLNDRTS